MRHHSCNNPGDQNDSCSCGNNLECTCQCRPAPASCGCHRTEGAEQSACEPCLGRVCGTSIHLDDTDFAESKSHLVYMDKIFSYNKATSCPILFNLDTGRTPFGSFQSDIQLSSPIRRGCGNCWDMDAGCGCCTLTPDAVFTVEGGTAVLDFIETTPQGNISSDQVTIDGYESDSVSFSNGQYTAGIASILSKIQKSRCIDAGLPTKHFFLLKEIGPWEIRATFNLYGTVNTGGRTCRFRAEFKLDDDAPNICVPAMCPSGFAIPDLALPCAINGIAPDIHFQFGGKLKMVNPEICIRSPFQPPVPEPVSGNETSCSCEKGGFPGFAPVLATQLVLEPSVHAESVRKTLFCTKACEGMLPCSPTATELSIESTECPDPFEPDCSCGSKTNVASLSPCRESAECNCNRQKTSRRESDAFQFNGCNGCTW